MDGVLLIDKEKGITSYDVIRRLKKVLPKGIKIGHAGTLDPFATGLLVVLIGRATKRNQEMQNLRKGYDVVAEFGYETDTYDPTGQITQKDKKARQISKQKIQDLTVTFKGKIKQVPPAFSAKKIRGKPSYELARKGIKVKLPPKEIKIYKFEVTAYNWPKVEFSIECSSGTYVRKLISDLGRGLNTYAISVDLRRTFIGGYNVSDAKKSQQIGDFEIVQELIC